MKMVAAARAAQSKRARNRRLMTRREVMDLIPISYPKIWAMMRSGTFPRSLAIGGKCVWREDEVQAWIDNLSKVKLKGDAPHSKGDAT
jgi:predicted DNA-binding transcriptional regulator AlpA